MHSGGGQHGITQTVAKGQHQLEYSAMGIESGTYSSTSCVDAESSGKRAGTGLLKSHPDFEFSSASAIFSGPKANDVPLLNCPLPGE